MCAGPGTRSQMAFLLRQVGRSLTLLPILAWKLMVPSLVPHGPLALIWVAQLAEPSTVTITVTACR